VFFTDHRLMIAAVRSAVLVPRLQWPHAGMTSLSGRWELSNNDLGGMCSRDTAARMPAQ
jgi:hypothetical protein